MKPCVQCLLNDAMNMVPKTPAAPRGVKKPSARERPPPTSPRITRLTQNQASLKPCFSKPCLNLARPEPPNQPKSFCVPWTTIVSPTTRRRMRRAMLIVIAIHYIPFHIVCLELPQLREDSQTSDCNLLECSITSNCKNVKYSCGSGSRRLPQTDQVDYEGRPDEATRFRTEASV